MSIINRLRNFGNVYDDDIELAADMLEFFFNQMEAHSLHMDATAGFLLRNHWPLTSVRAGSREEAVLECLRLIEEERNASKQD